MSVATSSLPSVRINAKRMLHKSLIFLHKWLGVALAVLLLMWFASGVVLYFVPFPVLSQVERLAGLPALRLPPGCCLTAAQAAGQAGLSAGEARLGMQAGLPVWRVLDGSGPDGRPQWRALDARNGLLLPPLPVEAAAALAEAFSGQKALHTEVLERDQWTVPQGLDPYRPLVRVELDGPGGLELYVSPAAAEVVRDTRRAERFWNWLGAVPHWIYFTELRKYPKTWHNLIVWLSISGVILLVTGIVLGVWHLYLNRSRWIPYQKFWMRWHHISGLVAAIFTLTWMFSGLLSMNPFGVFSARAALPAERSAWVGARAVAQLDPAAALTAAQGLQVREIDSLQVGGQAWYRLRGEASHLLLRADGTEDLKAMTALPDSVVHASMQALRPGAMQLTRLDFYDDQYYAREITNNTPYTRPLPVWRAQWADGVGIYADPGSGRLLLRADTSNRWQRILYNGLHSFDFAPLLARPRLRDTLIVLLSLLGTALCFTSCVIAWRVLFSAKRKRSSTSPDAGPKPTGLTRKSLIRQTMLFTIATRLRKRG
ncbi:MAG: PepSY-associated TM helix domain-containing protein [Polaromonas sp.]|uniref:PepSY-associated TM helix domain-containing protein n=1 Tax=Polaromonas sp. TaxID=1869339 RepID=UPI0027356040|nr:PepSY-associated TM helix domain-containing protein [Polaromonas sp.]MDP2817695.1 PepSY-associated TM helix domain-containing protein [Polaromonas sp.]